jgi:hypothetical protein
MDVITDELCEGRRSHLGKSLTLPLSVPKGYCTNARYAEIVFKGCDYGVGLLMIAVW